MMADMRLYYFETVNGRKACAMARHVGVPVEFVRVDLGKLEQQRPEFLALNPNGKVPVLDCGDGRVIWESNAILCELARRAGGALLPCDERLIDVVRWLSWNSEHFGRATVRFYFEHVIKPQFGLGSPETAALAAVEKDVRRYGAVLDAHLDGRRFLVGDGLTVADFAVAAMLPYAAQAKIPVDGFVAIARWHDRLNELDAWRMPFPALATAA
jgi:glutathione S-transferase